MIVKEKINSPHQHLRKCIEHSKESLNTDVKVLRVNNNLWLAQRQDAFPLSIRKPKPMKVIAPADQKK